MDILSYKKAKQAKSLAETGLSQSPNGGIDMFSQTWPIIGTFGAGNNGGTVDQTNKKITIPAGSSGKSSWLGWQFPVGKNFETLMNSKTIYLKFLVKHSIGFFTASNRVAALIQNSSGTNVLSSVTITAISDTLSEVSAAFSMPSTRYSWIEPCFQVGSTEVFSADAWVQIMSLKLYNNVYNLSNLNIILDDDAHVVKTVKPSGGDYASPKLAMDAIIDASPVKIYDLIIYPGIYTETGWNWKPYVNLIGVNKETCIIDGELAVSSDDTTITNTSTINVTARGDYTMKNLTVTGKNLRYPIHFEKSGDNPDTVIKLYNCHVEHYGNQAVKDYRIANSLDYSNLWASCNAWGNGTASGVYQYFEDCTFKSFDSVAWYVHNDLSFSKANICELKNCRCISPNGYSVYVQNLGSGTNDKLILNGCSLVGKIEYNDSPWYPNDISLGIENHAEFDIIGANNTPAPFSNVTRGTCLKIKGIASDDTSTSTVTVSGSAVSAILGDYKSFFGKGYLSGYVLGSLDISGVQSVTTLGQRLGDCTTMAKTLVINNGTEYTITFNQDYTNMTNAAIIAIINTALGAGYASEYAISKQYTPQFTDQIKTCYNASAYGISAGCPVAYINNNNSIRVMTNALDASLFAGFALEDINPGECGKIQVKGYIYKDFVLLKSGNLAFGSKYGISATQGKIVASGSPVIGKCLIADYLYFDANLY